MSHNESPPHNESFEKRIGKSPKSRLTRNSANLEKRTESPYSAPRRAGNPPKDAKAGRIPGAIQKRETLERFV